jgi:DNA-binding NtrC family response regulator
VLLLEDDASLRALLQDVLAEHGLDVRACASPAELQRAIEHGLGDVALVDPWGSSHPQLSDGDRQALLSLADAVPTILFTGRSWALRADPDDLHLLAIVPKPADVYGLGDLVRRAAEAVRTLRHQTDTLRSSRQASLAAQVSAQQHIAASLSLLRAVRARLQD